jgi:hypothetical protein
MSILMSLNPRSNLYFEVNSPKYGDTMHPHVKRFAVLVLTVAVAFIAARYVMIYHLAEFDGSHP